MERLRPGRLRLGSNTSVSLLSWAQHFIRNWDAGEPARFPHDACRPSPFWGHLPSTTNVNSIRHMQQVFIHLQSGLSGQLKEGKNRNARRASTRGLDAAPSAKALGRALLGHGVDNKSVESTRIFRLLLPGTKDVELLSS